MICSKFSERRFGVSRGNEKSHFAFAEKNKLQYPLLCDENNALREAFGATTFLGMLDGRVTYVIDSQGIIRHVFEDLLNGPAHIKDALKVLKEIQV